MAKELSKRQKKVLGFIREYTIQHGLAPSIREIGKACGISSTSVVTYNVERLVELGHLEKSSAVARGVRLAGSRFVLPGDRLDVVVDGHLVSGTYVVA